jgi:hypothetical protein
MDKTLYFKIILNIHKNLVVKVKNSNLIFQITSFYLLLP